MQDHNQADDAAQNSTETDIEIGDVCLDLAQGRPVHIIDEYDGTAAEWSDEKDYDLMTNYGNSRFNATGDDRVFEVVFCSSLKNKPTKPYAFPESRLCRVETEAADNGRQVADRIRVELLEELFDAAHRLGGDQAAVQLEAMAQDVAGKDMTEEARELARANRIGRNQED